MYSWVVEKMASGELAQEQRLHPQRILQLKMIGTPEATRQEWALTFLKLLAHRTVERIDQHYYVGRAPTNARSTQQAYLLLLYAVASETLTQHDWHTIQMAFQQLFSIPVASLRYVKEELQKCGAMEKQYYFRDKAFVVESAWSELRRFAFMLQPDEQEVDTFLAAISKADSMGELCIIFQEFKAGHRPSKGRYYGQQLLAAEGLLTRGSGHPQLNGGIGVSAYRQFAIAQRAWLRRNHCTETDDLRSLLARIITISS